MNKIIALSVICFSFLFQNCSQTFDLEKEKNTLSNISYQMTKALENGDIEKARETIAGDWKIYSCGFPMMTKEVWLKDFFPNFMPGDKVKITTLNIDWNISPSMAFSTSEDKWEWLDGSIPTGVFCATTIYEKRDGEWKVVQIHFTPKK